MTKSARPGYAPAARFVNSSWAASVQNDVQFARLPLSSSLLVRGLRTWAVLIGIDDYEHASRLNGAVKDALDVRAYLLGSLHVPQEHIRTLTNGDATRKRILDTLYSFLRDNDNIERGDTILVYFAGHGTTYPSPSNKRPSETVEAILPRDRGSSRFPTGKRTSDISDREIQLFMGELRDAKGENITVILDCCFSAGSSKRYAPTKARYEPPMEGQMDAMLAAAERNARKRWAAGSATRSDWRPDMSSHVVLVACRDDEVAEDTPQGGPFTQALLRTLRRAPTHNLTYLDLVEAVLDMNPELLQTPDVAGRCRDQLVFQIGCFVRVSVRPRKVLPLWEEDSSECSSEESLVAPRFVEVTSGH